jgi:hypothetical protein
MFSRTCEDPSIPTGPDIKISTAILTKDLSNRTAHWEAHNSKLDMARYNEDPGSSSTAYVASAHGKSIRKAKSFGGLKCPPTLSTASFPRAEQTKADNNKPRLQLDSAAQGIQR